MEQNIKMNGYLIDTDVLIDVSKGNKNAFLFLSSLENACVSIINSMELIVGARNNSEKNEIEKFLSQYNFVYINERVCSLAYNLLKKFSLTHGLTIPDSLIAATAISNNLNLVTKNEKHFKIIEDLKFQIAKY